MSSLKESCTAGVFVRQTSRLCGNFPMLDFYQIWPQHVSPCPLKTYWNGFFENLWNIFEHFPFTVWLFASKKPQNWTHLTLQPTGRNAQRYCSLSVVPVVQWPGSFWGNQLFCTCTVSELEYQSSPFLHFCLFSHIKCLKCSSGDSQGLHDRMLPVTPCSGGRSIGVHFASEASLWLLVW